MKKLLSLITSCFRTAQVIDQPSWMMIGCTCTNCALNGIPIKDGPLPDFVLFKSGLVLYDADARSWQEENMTSGVAPKAIKDG